jgi:magnesium transporter
MEKSDMPDDMAAGVQALARSFVRQFPGDAARRLEGLPPNDITTVVRAEPPEHAVPLLERLAPNVAAETLATLPVETASVVLGSMDTARAVAVLGWLDNGEREKLLATVDSSLARELRAMAEYPAETAGRLMDPHVLGFRHGTAVETALDRLRRVGRRDVSDVFVIDEEGRLSGRVPLQSLAVAAPTEVLDALATLAPSVTATATEQEVVDLFTERRLTSMPVVDFEGRLIGVIRQSTLVTTAQESAAADIQTMVGASRQERALSPVLFAVRKRLPWLEINLLTAFLAAGVVGLFESTIARFTALAVLMPVVAGQSGNTGAQALAVTMRGLALREIRPRHWPRVTRKEGTVALINGLAVALTTAGGVLLWSRSFGLATVIGVSMVLSMIAAGLSGVLVPVVLTSVGQDPAQSSSIILTTVTDVVGFSSFLGIATLLSGLL